MKKFLFVLLPALMLGSCIKKAEEKLGSIHRVKWSGTYAAPILNADLSLDDAVGFVSDFTGVKAYSDGLIYLEYAKKLISKNGNQLVPLPNQNSSFTDVLSTGEKNTLTGSNTVTISRDISFTYNNSGSETDSVLFSQGTLTVKLNNSYNHPGTATVTIPGLTKSGTAFTATFSFTANQQNLIQNLNLTGYTWDMTLGGSGYNYIKATLDITYTNSGSGFGGSDDFDVDITLNAQQFKRIHGYFGTQNLFNSQDSLELEIFSSSTKTGTYTFSDPRFKLKLNNSTGMPARLSTNSLKSSLNGNQTALTGWPATKDIGAAVFSGTVTSKTDSVFLDKNNSNFHSIIASKPYFIVYDVDVDANPDGKTQRNFLTAESELVLEVITELPFFGTAVDFLLEDTSDFDLGLGDEKDYIDWIVLRLEIENQIPAEMNFQGYFMDTFHVALDSFFEPFRTFILPATVDGSGAVTSASHDKYDLKYDRARVANIAAARRLRIKVWVNTSENGGSPVPVKITTAQHLKFKMGIHAKASVDEKL